jgi:hypothetical protein
MVDEKTHTIYIVKGLGQIKEIDGLHELKKGDLIKCYNMDYSIITNDKGEYIFRIAEIEHGEHGEAFIEYSAKVYKNKDLPKLFNTIITGPDDIGAIKI